MRTLFNRTLIFIYLSCSNHTGVELKQTLTNVNTKQINLSVLQYNMPKDTVFTITNTGKYPLAIQNVETCCGCTTPIRTKKTIKPGKNGELKVSYDAKYPGQFHKTITVFTNVQNGSIRLSISGEVELDEYEERK